MHVCLSIKRIKVLWKLTFFVYIGRIKISRTIWKTKFWRAVGIHWASRMLLLALSLLLVAGLVEARGNASVEKVRLVGDCFPNYVFYENVPNGTRWHGDSGMWLLKSLESFESFKLPPFEIITDLSPSNVTYEALQTVADGRADITLMPFGVTYERYKMADFSYKTGYGEIKILYAKSHSVIADPIDGVFDWPSYGFIALASLATTIMAWATLWAEGNHFTISQVLLYNFGHLMNQPLPIANPKPSSRRPSTEITLGFSMMFFEFIRVMYCSVIVGKLTALGTHSSIDSLQDVYDSEGLRIFITRRSFVDSAVDHIPLLKAMKDRIDYFDFPRENLAEVYSGLYEKILMGTHVIIDSSGNLNRHLREISGDCRFLPKNFGMSTEVLFGMPVAWPVRKGFPLMDRLNSMLMRLDAVGISPGTAKKNEGIFSDKTMEGSTCEELKKKDAAAAMQSNVACHKRDLTLGIVHLKRIAMFYGVGIAASCLAFFSEMMIAL